MTSDNPSVQEALNATPAEVKLRKEAIDDEFSSLEDKGTWTEVKSYKGDNKPLHSHIVLKVNRNKHDQAKKYKARIVAGGN